MRSDCGRRDIGRDYTAECLKTECAFFRPTFWRGLSDSGRDGMFGRTCVSCCVVLILPWHYPRTTRNITQIVWKEEEDKEDEEEEGEDEKEHDEEEDVEEYEKYEKKKEKKKEKKNNKEHIKKTSTENEARGKKT